MAALPQVGHAAVVHIEMIVREDMIRLYGFATPEEKAWFITLMTVQGVGARVALSILSTLTTGELRPAIALQDKAMVGRANGVGPKLAVRVGHRTQAARCPPASASMPACSACKPRWAKASRRATSPTPSRPSAISAIPAPRRAPPWPRWCSARAMSVETATLIRLGLRELSS